MLHRLFAAALLGILCVSPVAAGTLHDAVLDQLSLLEDGEKASVIVYMADRADIQVLSASLTERKASRAERHQEVIEALQAASVVQTPLLDRLEALKSAGEVDGYTAYWISNAVIFYGTESAIREIGDRTDVGLIAPNFGASLVEPVEMSNSGAQRGIGVTPGLRAILADRVWYELGITGAGRLLANLDTGVDGNHPALSARWRGVEHPWQECWLDLLGTGTTFPTDTNGHGTHVMGTECGLAPDDSIGVSPSAQWIACNAINQGVSGEFDNDIIEAFQWFADPDGDPGSVDDVADAVQNSWRINEGFGYPDCFDGWWDVIDNCEASGCAVVFSAGNEGPGSETIGSPPDRITTPYNCYAIGACDATNYGFPYPIASFSSRGPSGCDHATIKPEVCAPGVSVYSSIPGGGYSSSYSGTSMSGPHVTGIFGLLREANPDIEIDVMKDIIMTTSWDFGTTGEDNIYGMGFVNAYEAVLASLTGFGTLTGTITHSDTGNPVPGADVEVIEASRNTDSDNDGVYSAMIPAGTYTVRVTHPAFETATEYNVEVVDSEVTTLDFALDPSAFDATPPVIAEVSQPCATEDTYGPYEIEATITDNLQYVEANLVYRLNEGAFSEVEMALVGSDRYHAEILGQPLGTLIEFYVEARDAIGNTATDPAGAPSSLRQIIVDLPSLVLFEDDVEADEGWTLGVAGDNATAGLWERADPVGTVYDGQPCQPEDDHTDAPGVMCFVTGAAGGEPGTDDVDGGRTTLVSPIFDLSSVIEGKITYWRWYHDRGNSPDNDILEVDISSDGGASWSALERLDHTVNAWTEVSLLVCPATDVTSQMQLRVIAQDDPNNSICEAAIDDVIIEGYPGEVTAVHGPTQITGMTRLETVSPNPFNPTTQIIYELATQTDVKLDIFDVNGRLVETLVSGRQSPGRYKMLWDGTDRSGHKLASGLYFLRLRADGHTYRQRLTLLK